LNISFYIVIITFGYITVLHLLLPGGKGGF